jgi:hypothetical protein
VQRGAGAVSAGHAELAAERLHAVGESDEPGPGRGPAPPLPSSRIERSSALGLAFDDDVRRESVGVLGDIGEVHAQPAVEKFARRRSPPTGSKFPRRTISGFRSTSCNLAIPTCRPSAEARWLTAWSVEFRYGDDLIDPLDRPSALATATRVSDWAAALVPSDESNPRVGDSSPSSGIGEKPAKRCVSPRQRHPAVAGCRRSRSGHRLAAPRRAV